MNRASKADWLIPAGLIALTIVPLIFGVIRLTEIVGGAPVTPANQRFLETPLPVVLHILVVLPYCIVGAFQFSPGFRRRNRPWHRAAGRILAAFGLVSALTGLWMAHFYPWPEGDGELLYVIRLAFGVAMIASIVLAIRAIRRRDFPTHGAWMMRAYAIGIGAGTQVLTHLPWFIVFGKPDELPRALLMGAGWGINVLVAEWVIRRGRAHRSAPTIAPPVAIPAGATGVPSLQPRKPAPETEPPLR